eukprot:TRINITY_DN26703_c0_g1_i4.p1 TRINITY_DN26703_c0_g1~~TRINITY_DN26703_c0_g1_i4.p1  ORF type:complete len:718 (+),score=117.19 TRINITY_DN26703_c0_g1_i4:29-2155(+)
MKLTCLSKGSSFHFPPSHILSICGIRILLECPIDLSSLSIFSPIPTDSHPYPDVEFSNSCENSPISDSGCPKRRKTEGPLQASDLIRAEPWYKMVKNLLLWDVSSIDVVLISTPMGMLGLPFLTRDPRFSAKIYATEATARLGRLMMEDLISMHYEFTQVYGVEELGFPQWMKWEEIEVLPLLQREIAMGKNGAELGNWQPLYSAANVEDCVQKVQTLKYAEEACYNGSMVVKAFSSGLEIGSSNWMINGPRRNITYLSSSIFESAYAKEFDYLSLQGNDLVLFSDLSLLHGMTTLDKNADDRKNHIRLEVNDPLPSTSSVLRDKGNNGDEFMKSLVNSNELTEEMDKLSFICSCAINCVQGGGSVLIPLSRLGIILQLLEQMSLFLESSCLKVPIFVISSVAEETFAFTNVVPEWLSKQRQEKLYSGKALFGHVELIEGKKIHVFPAMYSSNLLRTWKEPCIVFCSHWSLRIGPVVHLLQRWRGDPNSLLVLEEGVDVDVALLPFKPMAMKVLQCSFLSGIKMQKVQPLLELLKPKTVLLPKELRMQLQPASLSSPSCLYYSEGETLVIPSLRLDFEADLSTDLAFQLLPRRTSQENIAVARFRGELLVSQGKHLLVSTMEPVEFPRGQLLHWGSINQNRLLQALQEKGINGSLDNRSITDSASLIYIYKPSRALIQISTTGTIISAADEALASLIFEAVNSVLDGI